jgi:hypothetical protein
VTGVTFRARRCAANPNPAKPISIMAQVEGSGTADAKTKTLMPSGSRDCHWSENSDWKKNGEPIVVLPSPRPAKPLAPNKSEPKRDQPVEVRLSKALASRLEASLREAAVTPNITRIQRVRGLWE